MFKKITRFCFQSFVIAALSLSVAAQNRPEPEAATGYDQKKAFVASNFMVSAANPYASWVGKRILNQGGNAIDAAVGIQAMLTLVEPQSSGIGGGAFMLYWDNKAKKLYTYDGRETAPQGVNAFLFMDKKSKPVPWQEAVTGGRAVAVPGVLKMLEMSHQKHGKLPWRELFTDAANTAEKGFTVSPRLANLLAKELHPGLRKLTPASNYFYPNGRPLKAGTLLKNTPLAHTLLDIASKGSKHFYTGIVAEDIAITVQESLLNPGVLSVEDLANYEAKVREPVCGNYKSYKVCGMAPPSSGGLTILQMLKMLEPYKLEQYQPDSPKAAHLFTQASRLAFADRAMYMADSDFTQLPYIALVNDAYLGHRSKLIDLDRDMGRARAGKPYPSNYFGSSRGYDLPSTSHFSIVDSEGNAVSMTTSIEFAFGSGLMTHGFMLNNQMTDFDFDPRSGQGFSLNRVEPNKRPRSSMSPTMVFDKQGRLVLVIGSPGGSRIIDYVAQSVVGVLDWGLDVQQAINLPKLTNRNDYTALERGTDAEKLEGPLTEMGHRVRLMDLNSGLHGIYIDHASKRLIGGADPRREGVVVGN